MTIQPKLFAHDQKKPDPKTTVCPCCRGSGRVNADPMKKGLPQAFPAELDTADFRAMWAQWIVHRREIRKKLTPSAIKRQIALCEKLGPADAMRAIEKSITCGWTGLFEPDHEPARAETEAETW